MRKARVFRHFIRILVLFLAASTSIVSYLGTVSALSILATPGHVKIPDGPIRAKLNLEKPNSMYVEVPIELTNSGVFDIQNLTVTLILKVRYGTNESIIIVSKATDFGDVNHGETFEGTIYADKNDFFSIGIINQRRAKFYADIIISCSYSLGLITMKAEIRDYEIM